MSQNGFAEDAEDAEEISPLDTSVARQARIYDYLLGAKDNVAADREAATQAIAAPQSGPAGDQSEDPAYAAVGRKP